MTIHFDKARRRWRFDFWRHGRRYQGYCLDATGEAVTSRAGALQAEGVARRRAEMEPKVARAHEMALAMCIADLTPVWKKQANWIERRRWLKEIIAFFGAETAIAAIDQARVDDYVSFCRTRKIRVWHGGPTRDPKTAAHAKFWRESDQTRAPATVNLYLGTLRQILGRAGAHRDFTTGRPAFEHLPTVPEIRRLKRKARPMPDQVAAEIMAIMPPHVIDAMALTAWFGFRRGEAFGLTRDQIDWQGQGIRLYAEDVKDGEDVFLPGSQAAMGWLRCLDEAAEALGQRRLILWRQKRKNGGEVVRPVKHAGHAWKRARELMLSRYGRTWRWHDLRAAFITNVAVGSGGVIAQTLARHSDLRTTQAYLEVTDDMRRAAVDRIGARPYLKVVGS